MVSNGSWQHQMIHQEAAVTTWYFTGSGLKNLFTDRVVQHKKRLCRDSLFKLWNTWLDIAIADPDSAAVLAWSRRLI